VSGDANVHLCKNSVFQFSKAYILNTWYKQMVVSKKSIFEQKWI